MIIDFDRYFPIAREFTADEWLWDEDYNDECANTFELLHIEQAREEFWGFE